MKSIERLQAITVAAALSLGAVGAASADSVKLGVGVDYTSGDYGGTDDITTTYIPFTMSYNASRWSVRAAVPYLEVTGPVTVLDASGQSVPGPDRTDSGLGDVLLGATLYDVVKLTEQRFYIDLTARIKFGTADENKGLGTGETDYALQMDWTKYFARLGLFGAVGYKMQGGQATDYLDNTAFALVGVDYRVVDSTRVGVIFDIRESAVAGNTSLRELTVFASFGDRSSVTVQPYVLAGLSDSSPDWGGGVLLRWEAQMR